MFHNFEQTQSQVESKKKFKIIKIIINGDPSKAFQFTCQNNNLNQKQIINAIQSQWSSIFKNNQKIRLFSTQGVQYQPSDVSYIKNKQTIYVSKGQDFDSNKNFGQYSIIKLIGQGGFGKVSLAQNIYTKQKVAIKVLKANRLGTTTDIDMIFRQAENMKTLNHPNIVKIINCYTLKDMKMVVMMEYMQGGQLKKLLNQKKRFSQPEARHYFKQLISAVDYCHNRNIIHRDLKLENILLGNIQETVSHNYGSARKIEYQQLQMDFLKMNSEIIEKDQQQQQSQYQKRYISSAKASIQDNQEIKLAVVDGDIFKMQKKRSFKSKNNSLSQFRLEKQQKQQKYPIIKVSDFGISGIADKFNTQIDSGTLKYMAPEILAKKQKSNTPAVDIWACGIILYNMIFGKHPFQAPDVAKKIISGQFSFPVEQKVKGSQIQDQFASQEVKDLINKLLCVDPKKRLKIWQIQMHPWVSFSSKKSISPKKRQTDPDTAQKFERQKNLQLQQLMKMHSLQMKKFNSQQDNLRNNAIHFNNQIKKPGSKFLKHKPNSLNFNNEAQLNFIQRMQEKKKSYKQFNKNDIMLQKHNEISKFYIPLSSVNGSWQQQKQYKPVQSKRLQKQKEIIKQQFKNFRSKAAQHIIPNRMNRNNSANGKTRVLMRSQNKNGFRVPSRERLIKDNKKIIQGLIKN